MGWIWSEGHSLLSAAVLMSGNQEQSDSLDKKQGGVCYSFLISQ